MVECYSKLNLNKNTEYVFEFWRSFGLIILFGFQVEFQAIRGGNEFGYIAIDDLVFLGLETCEFKPPGAQPTTTTSTTTTTTTKVSSTPAPTEPPGRKCKSDIEIVKAQHFFNFL